MYKVDHQVFPFLSETHVHAMTLACGQPQITTMTLTVPLKGEQFRCDRVMEMIFFHANLPTYMDKYSIFTGHSYGVFVSRVKHKKSTE
jgi:hypothetical protein